MFDFLGKKTKVKNNCILALDIGAEFIKAAVAVNEDDKLRILGFGHAKQKHGDMHNSNIVDIASVIKNAKSAIRSAEKASGIVASQLIIGISSESIIGEFSSIQFKRSDTTEKIDLAELKNIVHKAEWKSSEEARARIAKERGLRELDLKHIYTEITCIKIDGKEVKNPIGADGENIEIMIYHSFAKLEHFGALTTLASELDLDLVATLSNNYALSRSLIYAEGNDLNAVIIDMGSSTTDVSVIQNGVINPIKSFTIGGNIFTKRLAQILNVSMQEAEEIKFAYSDDMLEKQSYKIIRAAMKHDAEIWISGVEMSLDETEGTLPSKIFLCGGGTNLPEIKEILESHDSVASKVKFLFPKEFAIHDEQDIMNDQASSTVTALAKIGVELTSDEKILSTILKKVVNLKG